MSTTGLRNYVKTNVQLTSWRYARIFVSVVGITLRFLHALPSQVSTLQELMLFVSVKSTLPKVQLSHDNCKELLRFESECVDFLASKFLLDDYTRSGRIYRRKQMEIFFKFVMTLGFLPVVTKHDVVCSDLQPPYEQRHATYRFFPL